MPPLFTLGSAGIGRSRPVTFVAHGAVEVSTATRVAAVSILSSGKIWAQIALDLRAGFADEADQGFPGSSDMAMDAEEIERLIKASIPDAQVTIRDLAGDGDHYAATVISPSFKGKSRVQQHQLVYDALKGQMGGVLHALALQTGTPD
jgi:stress-induced morphogen